MEEDTKKPTISKAPIAVLLFIALGLIFNTVLNYTQSASLQVKQQERAVLGDENIQLNREQSEQLKILLEKVTNLENKLNNPEKSGKKE